MMFSSRPINTLCHCGNAEEHGYISDHSPVLYDVRYNDPNPILVEFRQEYEKSEIDLEAYLIWLEVEAFVGFYPLAQVEHAYLVIKRLKALK